MKTTSLNGIWEFCFTKDYTETPLFNSMITVPGCFDVMPGKFGKRGCGHYRRKVFTNGGKIMLTFDGCGVHAAFYWDGVQIGKTVLAYNREELIFDSGDAGEHELMVVTDNFLSQEPSEQFKSFYDFYAFGGIYSDVYLTEFEPEDIRHLAVIPLDHTTGEVKIQVECFEKNPETLKIAFDNGAEEEIPFASEFVKKVPAFKVWSPETPALHTLTVNGKSVSFGIRTLNWSGKRLLLNGKEIKLIGCNRHESHPEFGPATPENLILTDLTAIKEQGFNFVRGSHYPQKEFTLEICDRIGLLVWEEALGWGNHEPELTDPGFCDNEAEQCRRMVRKSINHPSVIIWGFLNEAETNKESVRPLIKRLRDTIREQDQSRPVTFASNRPAKDCCMDLVDILSLNIYPGWYDQIDCDPDGTTLIRPEFEKFAEQFKDVSKPMIVSEIGAAAIYGDHSGYRWSEEYQTDLLKTVVNAILDMDRYSGVALWLFCDANTYVGTGHYLGRPRGFNNKGMLTEHRKPKMSWYKLHELLIERGVIQ